MTMAHSLPVDVLSMVFDQLGQQRDFNTLLQCALTGKQLATFALTLLYRSDVPVKAESIDYEADFAIACMRFHL